MDNHGFNIFSITRSKYCFRAFSNLLKKMKITETHLVAEQCSGMTTVHLEDV